MEKEEQVGGDIYNTEKEAASEKTQEIRKSGNEPTDCETGGKVADKMGRLARERMTGREASKRGRPSNVDRLQRGRTDSVWSILDYYGRKRERVAEEGDEGEDGATRKRCNSETAQLSPSSSHRKEEGREKINGMDIEKLKGMSDVQEMIMFLATNMSKENEALKNEVKQLRQDLESDRANDKKRIDELAKKIDDKFGEWETKLNEIRNDEKIVELERKVKELSENINSETPTGQMNMIENSSMNKRMEDLMERKEREDRKNNIIIKGLV